MVTNKLHLAAIEPDGLVHVAADGNLTCADTRATGANLFESLLGANWAGGRVILDLGRCTWIDSAAIGWLVESHRQFKSAGGALVIFAVAPRVRQILELLKLNRILALAATEEAARAVLKGVASPSQPAAA